MISRRAAILTLAALGLAPPALAQTKIPIVATFTVLADFAREIGGDRVEVSSIVGPNGDVHVYDPSPADSRAIAAARLVIENGFYLEGWISRLAKASGAKALVVVATKDVAPREDRGNAEFAAHHGIDPHAWQSVPNAKIYVANIRDGMIAVDPAGRGEYEARASAYLTKLDALDAQVRAAIAKISPADRRIITTHDAFGYFAQTYGMAFVAPAGVSTEAEASARDVGQIIAQIRREKFPAVFLENVSDRRLMDQIARETGAKIGGTLYSDALSPPDGPAGTYIDMMKHNISELTKALAP
ncbi:MAG: metal ABC transporter substrate-binding protein [Hyphomicrobiales bacterium]|nr:metal ABC transporter substrate-binding protein [Hyphomicrobiales bacterium]